MEPYLPGEIPVMVLRYLAANKCESAAMALIEEMPVLKGLIPTKPPKLSNGEYLRHLARSTAGGNLKDLLTDYGNSRILMEEVLEQENISPPSDLLLSKINTLHETFKSSKSSKNNCSSQPNVVVVTDKKALVNNEKVVETSTNTDQNFECLKCSSRRKTTTVEKRIAETQTTIITTPTSINSSCQTEEECCTTTAALGLRGQDEISHMFYTTLLTDNDLQTKLAQTINEQISEENEHEDVVQKISSKAQTEIDKFLENFLIEDGSGLGDFGIHHHHQQQQQQQSLEASKSLPDIDGFTTMFRDAEMLLNGNNVGCNEEMMQVDSNAIANPGISDDTVGTASSSKQNEPNLLSLNSCFEANNSSVKTPTTSPGQSSHKSRSPTTRTIGHHQQQSVKRITPIPVTQQSTDPPAVFNSVVVVERKAVEGLNATCKVTTANIEPPAWKKLKRRSISPKIPRPDSESPTQANKVISNVKLTTKSTKSTLQFGPRHPPTTELLESYETDQIKESPIVPLPTTASPESHNSNPCTDVSETSKKKEKDQAPPSSHKKRKAAPTKLTPEKAKDYNFAHKYRDPPPSSNKLTDQDHTTKSNPSETDSAVKKTPLPTTSSQNNVPYSSSASGRLENSNSQQPDVTPMQQILPTSSSLKTVSPTALQRLIASANKVGTSGPPISYVHNRKKSYSTPRKRKHVRSLTFATPPSLKGVTPSSCIDGNYTNESGKRKAVEDLFSKEIRSKKRLDWAGRKESTNNIIKIDAIVPTTTTTTMPVKAAAANESQPNHLGSQNSIMPISTDKAQSSGKPPIVMPTITEESITTATTASTINPNNTPALSSASTTQNLQTNNNPISVANLQQQTNYIINLPTIMQDGSTQIIPFQLMSDMQTLVPISLLPAMELLQNDDAVVVQIPNGAQQQPHQRTDYHHQSMFAQLPLLQQPPPSFLPPGQVNVTHLPSSPATVISSANQINNNNNNSHFDDPSDHNQTVASAPPSLLPAGEVSHYVTPPTDSRIGSFTNTSASSIIIDDHSKKNANYNNVEPVASSSGVGGSQLPQLHCQEEFVDVDNTTDVGCGDNKMFSHNKERRLCRSSGNKNKRERKHKKASKNKVAADEEPSITLSPKSPGKKKKVEQQQHQFPTIQTAQVVTSSPKVTVVVKASPQKSPRAKQPVVASVAVQTPRGAHFSRLKVSPESLQNQNNNNNSSSVVEVPIASSSTTKSYQPPPETIAFNIVPAPLGFPEPTPVKKSSLDNSYLSANNRSFNSPLITPFKTVPVSLDETLPLSPSPKKDNNSNNNTANSLKLTYDGTRTAQTPLNLKHGIARIFGIESTLSPGDNSHCGVVAAPPPQNVQHQSLNPVSGGFMCQTAFSNLSIPLTVSSQSNSNVHSIVQPTSSGHQQHLSPPLPELPVPPPPTVLINITPPLSSRNHAAKTRPSSSYPDSSSSSSVSNSLKPSKVDVTSVPSSTQENAVNIADDAKQEANKISEQLKKKRSSDNNNRQEKRRRSSGIDKDTRERKDNSKSVNDSIGGGPAATKSPKSPKPKKGRKLPADILAAQAVASQAVPLGKGSLRRSPRKHSVSGLTAQSQQQQTANISSSSKGRFPVQISSNFSRKAVVAVQNQNSTIAFAVPNSSSTIAATNQPAESNVVSPVVVRGCLGLGLGSTPIKKNPLESMYPNMPSLGVNSPMVTPHKKSVPTSLDDTNSNFTLPPTPRVVVEDCDSNSNSTHLLNLMFDPMSMYPANLLLSSSSTPLKPGIPRTPGKQSSSSSSPSDSQSPPGQPPLPPSIKIGSQQQNNLPPVSKQRNTIPSPPTFKSSNAAASEISCSSQTKSDGELSSGDEDEASKTVIEIKDNNIQRHLSTHTQAQATTVTRSSSNDLNLFKPSEVVEAVGSNNNNIHSHHRNIKPATTIVQQPHYSPISPAPKEGSKESSIPNNPEIYFKVEGREKKLTASETETLYSLLQMSKMANELSSSNNKANSTKKPVATVSAISNPQKEEKNPVIQNVANPNFPITINSLLDFAKRKGEQILLQKCRGKKHENA